MKSLPAIAIIPNFGFIGGANWGLDFRLGMYNDPHVFAPKLELPSVSHDFDYSLYDMRLSPAGTRLSRADGRWARGVWTTPGPEPGVYGQAYRLIGSAFFGALGATDIH